ncbi:hypothetical protein AALP_AA8G089800 [Arabis alpina]|uniref:Zinc knuckle CX2CX4HX4C domain-containing protein n=1 Tax=Arabis alpina TaxID=50452 RepID=A0A087G5W4_ARAAL|nr:hypothetical protein AALP_AA8G089800 [Arabis alpina]
MCYTCQGLTHEQDKCPLFLDDSGALRTNEKNEELPLVLAVEHFLKEGDPLYGVMSEEQVGLDPSTGGLKIAEEILEGMRLYLLTPGDALLVKEARVRSSVAELMKDPIQRKLGLSLDSVPIITSEVDKDKGIVFDYEPMIERKQKERPNPKVDRLMKEAFARGAANSRLPLMDDTESDGALASLASGPPSFYDHPSASRVGFSEASYSGISKRKGKPRKRPHLNKRKQNRLSATKSSVSGCLKEGDLPRKQGKRKAEAELEGSDHEAQRLKTMIVPIEKLSNPQ